MLTLIRAQRGKPGRQQQLGGRRLIGRQHQAQVVHIPGIVRDVHQAFPPASAGTLEVMYWQSVEKLVRNV